MEETYNNIKKIAAAMMLTAAVAVISYNKVFSQSIKINYMNLSSSQSFQVPYSQTNINISVTFTVSDMEGNEELYKELMNEALAEKGYDEYIQIVSINGGSGSIVVKTKENSYSSSRTLTISGKSGPSATVTQAGQPPTPPEPSYIPDEKMNITGNWFLTRTYITGSSSKNLATRVEDITFYDGNGYASQMINVAASATTGRNIIRPVVYDAVRRSDTKTYLPYVSSSNSAHIQESGDVISSQNRPCR